MTAPLSAEAKAILIVWSKDRYDSILADMRDTVKALDAGIMAIVKMRNIGWLQIIEPENAASRIEAQEKESK